MVGVTRISMTPLGLVTVLNMALALLCLCRVFAG